MDLQASDPLGAQGLQAARELLVFYPPLCCPGGVCGPEDQRNPELLRFHANLGRLAEHFDGRLQVVQLDFRRDFDRYRLNGSVRSLLKTRGKACLPILMLDDEVILSGGYPAWEELYPAVEQRLLGQVAESLKGEIGN